MAVAARRRCERLAGARCVRFPKATVPPWREPVRSCRCRAHRGLERVHRVRSQADASRAPPSSYATAHHERDAGFRRIHELILINLLTAGRPRSTQERARSLPRPPMVQPPADVHGELVSWASSIVAMRARTSSGCASTADTRVRSERRAR